METDYPKELKVIESMLVENIELDIITINQLIKKLKGNFTNSQFLDSIKALLQSKTIVFVRHAESLYNQWKSKSIFRFSYTYENCLSNYDPLLTKKGKDQCKKLIDLLDTENKHNFDLVLVSPLQRALQTALIISESKTFEKCSKMIACHLFREKMDSAGDIGTHLSSLKPLYPKICFDYIIKENWWFDGKEQQCTINKRELEPIIREKDTKIRSRFILGILWVIYRPERNICIVSHSQAYKILMGLGLFNQKIKNAELIELPKDKILILCDIWDIHGLYLGDYLNENNNYIVTFYTSWCKHSQQFLKEFLTLDSFIQRYAYPIQPIKINLDNKEISKVYGLSETPSIFLSIRGKWFEYNGAKNAVDLLFHLIEILEVNILELKSIEDYQQYLNRNQGILVHYMRDDGDIKDPKILLRTIRKKLSIKHMMYLYTMSENMLMDANIISCANKCNHSEENLYLIRQFHPKVVEIDIVDDFDKLSSSVLNALINHLHQFDEVVFNYIFRLGNPAIILIMTQQVAIDDHYVEILTNFIDQAKPNISSSILILNTSNIYEGTILDLLGIANPEEIKIEMRIVEPQIGWIKQYKMQMNFDLENMMSYYRFWKMNLLKPSLKSEPVPNYFNENLNKAKKLTGINFWDRVHSTSEDSYVLFYHRRCGKLCDHYIMIMDALALEMRKYSFMQFYKIDMALNDIQNFSVPQIPSLGVFPKFNKMDIIWYDKEYISKGDVNDFIKSILERSGVQWHDGESEDLSAVKFSKKKKATHKKNNDKHEKIEANKNQQWNEL